jgi:hypothetical protein
MTGRAPDRLLTALQEIGKELPRLRVQHLECVNAQGLLEHNLGAMQQAVFDTDEAMHLLDAAISAQNLAEIQRTHAKLRDAHAAVTRLFSEVLSVGSKCQGVTEAFYRVLRFLGRSKLRPALRAVEVPAGTPPADAELLSEFTLTFEGLAPDEVRLIMRGVMMGLQLATGREFNIPAVLEQIERQQRGAVTSMRELN